MGTRIKTFVSTGIAPDGRLFAGDLNQIEDQYADQSNLGQTLGVGTIQVGETGLQVIRYGAGEMRVSGALRTDGILRGLGGLYAGAFTTTQRDAIPTGSRPYGLVILNTTTNRLEINIGTDPSPTWQGLGAGAVNRGTLGTRPGPSAGNANSFYFATDDNGGTLYYSDGSVWTKVSKGLTELPVVHASTHLPGSTDVISWVTVLNFGTLASRPAAGSTNTNLYYFATDDTGGTLYQSNGSAWQQRTIGLTDSRLTNSRTPTAHHATHEPGGGDTLDFTTINRSGLLASRPAASSFPGQFYFATDANGGTLYQSVASAWSQVAFSATIADGSLTPAKIAGTAVITSDARLSDARTPTANSVDNTKVADGALSGAKITDATLNGAKITDTTVSQAKLVSQAGGAFPTTGLFNGYRYVIFMTFSYGNGSPENGMTYLCVPCTYRADLDATYPWHVEGVAEFLINWSGSFQTNGMNLWPYIYAPRNGVYIPRINGSGTSGGGGGIGFGIFESNISGYDFQEVFGANNWWGYERQGTARGLTGGIHYVQGTLNSVASNLANYSGHFALRPMKLI